MRSCTRRIVVHTTTTRTRVVLRSRESLRPLSTKGSTDSSRSSSRAVDESRSRAVDESRSRVAGESSSSRVAAADEGGHSFLEDHALRRNVFTLVGSQIMLNIGVSQVVPVLPVLASETYVDLHSTILQRYYGTNLPRHHGTMAPWYHGAVVLVPCCHDAIVPWYHCVMASRRRGTMLPW